MAARSTWHFFAILASFLMVGFFSGIAQANNTPADASVIHIVQFQFTNETSQSDKLHVAQEMLSLKYRCLKPETGLPFIKSLTGGANNSPEGAAEGLEYAFVVEFNNDADRDWYVWKCPAHQAFKALVKPEAAKAVIVDYNKGVFYNSTG